MARHYHLELADLWRHDELGRRRLTWRRLRVLIAHLPADSAVARITHPSPFWSVGDVLLAHIWQTVARSKRQHPMLLDEWRRVASAPQLTPVRAKAVAGARRRALERRKAIEAGTIT